MTAADLIPLLPFIIIAAASVIIMLVATFRRNHSAAYLLTLVALGSALAFVFGVSSGAGRITSLLIIDSYALFYTGLILVSGMAVTVLSYCYLKGRKGNIEEYYILLLLAILGSSTLVTSNHFASFFMGLEILSISLYALIGYTRNELSIEAGVKYLVLAAVSSAFILFGIALLYGEAGTMDFTLMGPRIVSQGVDHSLVLTGLAMTVIGIGFKLAVVPFHMWTPDVYEGAPAPVTAFVATISKGAMFALLLRYFALVDIQAFSPLFYAFTIIAIISMFTGNLLALFQNNVKRILAYSSIAHLGYLLVAFLASGTLRTTAVSFYLVAYFITTIGAFGVIVLLSGKERDADAMDDYRGLVRRAPWLAGIFSAMLFSLAGIPLTAGFVGKFYVIAAGAGSALWLLIITLVINSAIGLFYYLRIIIAMYTQPAGEISAVPHVPFIGGLMLVAVTILLIWLGVYPGPLMETIHFMTSGL